MKKSDLILKMKNELVGYQIGLHNISLTKYNSLIREGKKKDKQIDLTGAVVSEKVIAENILVNGLYIADKARGMLSTVLPTRCVGADCFLDYVGWSDFSNRDLSVSLWNVIIAIPYVINYEGSDYFIGDITDVFNLMGRYSIANSDLFDSSIPKEFIYGYYEMVMEKDNPYFVDDIYFYENPNFFEKLDKERQKVVFKILLTTKKRLLYNLKLANDDSKFKLLFRTSRERNMINATRKQKIYFETEKKITTKFK